MAQARQANLFPLRYRRLDQVFDDCKWNDAQQFTDANFINSLTSLSQMRSAPLATVLRDIASEIGGE